MGKSQYIKLELFKINLLLGNKLHIFAVKRKINDLKL